MKKCVKVEKVNGEFTDAIFIPTPSFATILLSVRPGLSATQTHSSRLTLPGA